MDNENKEQIINDDDTKVVLIEILGIIRSIAIDVKWYGINTDKDIEKINCLIDRIRYE